MANKDNPLVIVPTYNEAENIRHLIESIQQLERGIEILVIDDGSPDGTADLVKQLMVDHPESVHLVQRSGKLGLGSAYVTGFKWALDRGYPYVIQMDADFSHPPSALVQHMELLSGGQVGVSIGSRYVEGGGTENWGLVRRFISRGGGLYARTILGMSTRDLTGGFNGWSSQVLSKLHLDSVASEGYAFQIELKHRAHLMGESMREFPIIFCDRKAGHSKMSSRIFLEAIVKVWHFRFNNQAALTKSMGHDSL